MHSLPVLMRLTDRPVVLVGDDEMAAAKRRLLERAGAVVVAEDDRRAAEARLAIVALADDDDAEAAVARLKARGMIVNAVDRLPLCDFTLPAIVDRDPVLIGIGTGGASAGLAKALRQRLETLLPARLGALATALGAARAAMRARWPDGATRRRAIDAALGPGGPLDPFGGGGTDGAAAVERWLAADATASTAMSADRLVRILIASPDPDALTLGTARLLGGADRVYHRPDVPAAILDRARADAARIACSAAPADPGPGLSLDLEMRG
ncbi:siroheme synthase [Sphingomonas changnyeongensis]|uniref:precorrin-2 dehydrogenase n=1 Tax=Sphingomonas changnyeongensis TaxID=2698679 RepID=A0A7Z2NW50_9SPHN|nr:NAD(P)-dependent oxidoreductase [Sphingomonas changnyeongensis]QHL90334.1 siroheme synthase [Sphingomonas changnyeongensis]